MTVSTAPGLEDTADLIGAARRLVRLAVQDVVAADFDLALSSVGRLDADMTAYLAAADRLRERFGCLVIIVHHSGLEGGRPRGHSSLTGAADVQIAITRKGDTSSLLVEFLKDGQEGLELHGQLVGVDVGHDKTSCVIVEAAAPETPQTPTKKAKVEDILLAILADSNGLSADMWQSRAKLRLDKELSRNDFWKAKKALLEAGLITVGDDGIFRASP